MMVNDSCLQVYRYQTLVRSQTELTYLTTGLFYFNITCQCMQVTVNLYNCDLNTKRYFVLSFNYFDYCPLPVLSYNFLAAVFVISYPIYN